MKITRLLSVKFLPLFFILLITTTKAGAQLPIFDKITGKAAVKDTVSKVNEITLETVNAEIEYTDNLLFKRKVNEFDDGEQLLLIHNIDSFNVFITKQGQEFKSFSSNKIWRFYLINERVNWEEYQDRLRDYQKEIQKEIRNLQETQSYYSSNYYKWKQSLPVIEKDLSPQILNYVLSNLEKLKQVDDFYDKRIKELVSKENKIVQDVVYTDGILREINAQILKRKNELFKKNEPNIFETKYKKSFSGSFSDRIQLAFYENTKNFGYFADIIRRNFISYLVFFSFLIGYLLFIRKKFKGLNLSSEGEEFKFFNRIIVELPAITLIIIIIILWNLFTPYTPFIISLLLYLVALVLLYIVFAPIVSAILKKITLLLIVLFIIANLEVFAWYFGNYSRFYLLLESIAGIVISNKYILPINKTKYFSNQNRKVTFYTRAIGFAIFILSITGLLANLTGYENLAGYSNKLGIFTGLISILAFGFHRLLYSLFGASIHVLNIYYPDLVAKHGDNILRRTKQVLNAIVVFFWVTSILRVAEEWEPVYSKFKSLLTFKIIIGSLSFTPGKILFFLLTLYLTYNLATFIKRIFEREILAKHKLKRGLAASISLTLRIFLVFFGTLIALSVSGLDLGKISIIAGALSVGIGFGLQNIVSNFISGLILIYEKPVMEGDTVEVDNLLGRVSNIGIRSSTLITYDGAEVVVPNSNLISNQLINWTLSDNKKRVEIKVGTSYHSDPNKVLELLLDAANSHKKVMKDPTPQSFFSGFGDSSLNFRILFWVKFEDGLQTQSDVAIKIYNLLKENNIEIPFPQLDLHIKEREN